MQNLEISQEEIDAIKSISKKVGVHAEQAGFRDPSTQRGTKIALIHSELSEALEADRKNLNDDHLPQYLGCPAELADAVIRIFEMCDYEGWDIATIIADKHHFNMNREDHKIENRMKEHGKRY